MPERIKSFYSDLVKTGYNLPDQEIFSRAMQDSTKRELFYNDLVKDGFKLPDIGTFHKAFSYDEPDRKVNLQSNDQVKQLPGYTTPEESIGGMLAQPFKLLEGEPGIVRSGLEATSQNVTSAAVSVEALSNLIRQAEENLPKPLTGPFNAAASTTLGVAKGLRGIAEFWDKQAQYFQEPTGEFAETPKSIREIADPRRFTQLAVQAAPFSVAAATTRMVSKPLSAIMIASVEGGGAIQEAQQLYKQETGEDLPAWKAAYLGIAVGSTNAIIEGFNLDILFGAIEGKMGLPFARAIKSRLIASMISGSSELATEVLQRTVSLAGEAAILPPEVLAKMNIPEQLWQEAISAIPMSFGFAGTGYIGNRLQNWASDVAKQSVGLHDGIEERSSFGPLEPLAGAEPIDKTKQITNVRAKILENIADRAKKARDIPQAEVATADYIEQELYFESDVEIGREEVTTPIPETIGEEVTPVDEEVVEEPTVEKAEEVVSEPEVGSVIKTKEEILPTPVSIKKKLVVEKERNKVLEEATKKAQERFFAKQQVNPARQLEFTEKAFNQLERYYADENEEAITDLGDTIAKLKESTLDGEYISLIDADKRADFITRVDVMLRMYTARAEQGDIQKVIGEEEDPTVFKINKRKTISNYMSDGLRNVTKKHDFIKEGKEATTFILPNGELRGTTGDSGNSTHASILANAAIVAKKKGANIDEPKRDLFTGTFGLGTLNKLLNDSGAIRIAGITKDQLFIQLPSNTIITTSQIKIIQDLLLNRSIIIDAGVGTPSATINSKVDLSHYIAQLHKKTFKIKGENFPATRARLQQIADWIKEAYPEIAIHELWYPIKTGEKDDQGRDILAEAAYTRNLIKYSYMDASELSLPHELVHHIIRNNLNHPVIQEAIRRFGLESEENIPLAFQTAVLKRINQIQTTQYDEGLLGALQKLWAQIKEAIKYGLTRMASSDAAFVRKVSEQIARGEFSTTREGYNDIYWTPNKFELMAPSEIDRYKKLTEGVPIQATLATFKFLTGKGTIKIDENFFRQFKKEVEVRERDKDTKKIIGKHLELINKEGIKDVELDFIRRVFDNDNLWGKEMDADQLKMAIMSKFVMLRLVAPSYSGGLTNQEVIAKAHEMLDSPAYDQDAKNLAAYALKRSDEYPPFTNNTRLYGAIYNDFFDVSLVEKYFSKVEYEEGAYPYITPNGLTKQFDVRMASPLSIFSSHASFSKEDDIGWARVGEYGDDTLAVFELQRVDTLQKEYDKLVKEKGEEEARNTLIYGLDKKAADDHFRYYLDMEYKKVKHPRSEMITQFFNSSLFNMLDFRNIKLDLRYREGRDVVGVGIKYFDEDIIGGITTPDNEGLFNFLNTNKEKIVNAIFNHFGIDNIGSNYESILDLNKVYSEFAAKAMIQWAAQNGYKKVRFSTGDTADVIEGIPRWRDEYERLVAEKTENIAANQMEIEALKEEMPIHLNPYSKEYIQEVADGIFDYSAPGGLDVPLRAQPSLSTSLTEIGNHGIVFYKANGNSIVVDVSKARGVFELQIGETENRDVQYHYIKTKDQLVRFLTVVSSPDYAKGLSFTTKVEDRFNQRIKLLEDMTKVDQRWLDNPENRPKSVKKIYDNLAKYLEKYVKEEKPRYIVDEYDQSWLEFELSERLGDLFPAFKRILPNSTKLAVEKQQLEDGRPGYKIHQQVSGDTDSGSVHMYKRVTNGVGRWLQSPLFNVYPKKAGPFTANRRGMEPVVASDILKDNVTALRLMTSLIAGKLRSDHTTALYATELRDYTLELTDEQRQDVRRIAQLYQDGDIDKIAHAQETEDIKLLRAGRGIAGMLQRFRKEVQFMKRELAKALMTPTLFAAVNEAIAGGNLVEIANRYKIRNAYVKISQLSGFESLGTKEAKKARVERTSAEAAIIKERIEVEFAGKSDKVKEKAFKKAMAEYNRASFLADVVDEYKAVDYWGLENYVTKIEGGTFVLLNEEKNAIAFAFTQKDAVARAIKYLEDHPEEKIYIDNTVLHSLASTKVRGATKKHQQQLAASLNKSHHEIMAVVDAHFKKFGRIKMTSEVRVGPLQKREDILEGDPDFVRAMYSYIYQVSKAIHLTVPKAKIARYLGEIAQSDKDMADILRDSVNAAMGEYSWEDQQFDKFILGLQENNKVMGKLLENYKPGALGRFARGTKRTMGTLALAMRVGLAGVNLIDGQLRTWSRAGTRLYINGVSRLRTKEGKERMDSLIQYEGVGIDVDIERGVAVEGKHVDISGVLTWLFRKPEKPNRRVALMTFIEMGEKVYGLNREQANEFALTYMWMTQNIYTAPSMVKALRHGPLLSTRGQFQSIIFNTVEFLRTTTPAQLGRYFAMSMFLVGPMAVVHMLQALSFFYPWWEDELDEIENHFNLNYARISRGLIGVATGWDVTKQFSVFVGTPGEFLAGMTFGKFADLKSIASKWIDNDLSYKQDARDFFARSSGIVWYLLQAFEAMYSSDHTIKDSQGRELYKPVNLMDWIGLFSGVKPISLSAQQEVLRQFDKNIQKNTTNVSALLNQWVDEMMADKRLYTIIKQGVLDVTGLNMFKGSTYYTTELLKYGMVNDPTQYLNNIIKTRSLPPIERRLASERVARQAIEDGLPQLLNAMRARTQ